MVAIYYTYYCMLMELRAMYSDKIILANQESYNVTETKMIQKPTTTGEGFEVDVNRTVTRSNQGRVARVATPRQRQRRVPGGGSVRSSEFWENLRFERANW